MRISSLLKVVPEEGAARDPLFRVVNQSVYFSGECERCRPHCGSLCCTGYGFVALTEEEAKSGRYRFKEASEECGCAMCRRMLQADVKYTLLKQADGSCMYLDGERRCSIYEDRPETCRKYNCRDLPFRLTVR